MQYRCKRCSATCESKNPITRSVFLDNQTEALLSHTLKFKIVEEHGLCWFRVSLLVEPTTTELSGLQRLYAILRRMVLYERTGYPSLEQYACIHEWEEVIR